MDHATLRMLGITGDSLTLLGSMTLAAETLLRPRAARRNRASLGTAEELQAAQLDLVDEAGKPINQETLEDRDNFFGRLLAVVGVVLLVTGFAFLLVLRIWGE